MGARPAAAHSPTSPRPNPAATPWPTTPPPAPALSGAAGRKPAPNAAGRGRSGSDRRSAAARWRRQCGRLRGCFGDLRRCARGPGELRRDSVRGREDLGRVGTGRVSGEWKRRMGPGAEHRRLGPGERAGDWNLVEGVVRVTRLEPSRPRRSTAPYAQELVSHTACCSEWAMKTQRPAMERWLSS